MKEKSLLSGKADVATLLAAFRLANGLSQKDFAKFSGLSVKSIRNWEQGVRAPDLGARLWLSFVLSNPAEAFAHVARQTTEMKQQNDPRHPDNPRGFPERYIIAKRSAG